MIDLAARARKETFFQTIDGMAVASQFETVIDPATGEAFQRSPVATAAELDQAVECSRRSQPGWNGLGWDQRAAMLDAFAAAISREQEWLATLHTMEQGMPLPLSRTFVAALPTRMRSITRRRVPGEVLVDEPGRRVTETWHPLGVVAAIAPWNGPLLLGMIKVATALIAGNAVVLKPSELTPLSTLELGRIGREILPRGVFNVVGGGAAVGAAMASHPGFDKLSFTGSTPTGIAIARASAQFLRPVTLELGGNDAAILLDDGPVEALVALAAQLGFVNCGQFCAAIKRIYAPRHKVQQVAAGLAALAGAHRLGNGLEPGITMGPIQNRAQFDKVCAIVDDAKAAGARIVAGGAPRPGPGYFYPPTVVTDIGDGTRLVDEEQFGPVIPVVAYDSVDRVIEQVNAGPYGLMASVWTRDLEQGERIAARLHVGSVAVNRHAAFDPDVPFPLIKQSGMGIDYADHGIKATMRMQVVTTIPHERDAAA